MYPIPNGRHENVSIDFVLAWHAQNPHWRNGASGTHSYTANTLCECRLKEDITNHQWKCQLLAESCSDIDFAEYNEQAKLCITKRKTSMVYGGRLEYIQNTSHKHYHTILFTFRGNSNLNCWSLYHLFL